MKIKLLYPFTFEGQEVRHCKVVRRPTVKDRIKAVLWAKGKYGDTGENVPDAISVYLISELCEFEGKKIPADFLEENLDYEDFVRIWEAVILFRSGNSDKNQNTQGNSELPNAEGMELQRAERNEH